MTAAATPVAGPDFGRDLKVTALIGLAHGFSHFFQLVLPPLFPFLRTEFGVGYTELGLMMTLFYVSSGLMQTPAGFLVDRFGARRVLFSGLGLLAGATLLFGLAPGYWLLLPLVVLAGIGNSVFHPADLSILTGSIAPQRLGRAYGMHTLGGNLGWAAAPVLMLALTAVIGWRAALTTAGLMGLAALALLVFNRDQLRAESAHRKVAASAEGPTATAAVAPLFATPVLMGFGYFLWLSVALIAVQNFLPPTLGALWGTPLALASAALTGFLLGASAGVMAGGILADRSTRHDRIVVSGLAAGAVMIVLAGTTALDAPALIAAVTAAGFLMGITTPSRDMLVRAAAPKGATGRVFGFVYSGLDAGSALAPAAVGLMLDASRADLVPWFIVAMLGAAMATALLLRRVAVTPAA